MQWPDELRGQDRASHWLNKLLRKCKASFIEDSPQIRCNRGTHGTTLELTENAIKQPGESGVITQYRVRSVANDHLVCREFDGTTEGSTDVLIAKPYNLRRTGWHGIAVTYMLEPYPGAPATMTITYTYVTAVYRTASVSVGGAAGTEHQVIIPRYVANKSVIFASGVANGTGVSGTELVDINADGRAWGRVL